MSLKKLICGIGINDADYKVRPMLSVNGPRADCPYYRTWKSMITRCYSARYHKKHPTYTDCEVAEEWHYFMAFRSWMMQQGWEGKHLDKDVLVKGNRIYGPTTCVFISKEVNMFLLDSAASRGDFPIGVSRRVNNGNYSALVNEGGKRQRWIGTFKTPEEAHEAWRKAKHERALELARKQSDPRVAQALLTRYDY